jgi:predicted  nucleic acid-binding Zn-ribbon protein
MSKLCLVCGAVFEGNTCPKCGEGSFERIADPLVGGVPPSGASSVPSVDGPPAGRKVRK